MRQLEISIRREKKRLKIYRISRQHVGRKSFQNVTKNPETFQKLESDEIQKRWAGVRDEIEKYKTKSEILYVLDWPASNGNFYWIK